LWEFFLRILKKYFFFDLFFLLLIENTALRNEKCVALELSPVAGREKNVDLSAMAADSDGELVETVVTCQGNLHDPEFPHRFQNILDRLENLLCKSKLK